MNYQALKHSRDGNNEKVIILYVESDKEAGVNCSLLEMLEEMEVLDYEIRPMTKAEVKVFD